MARGARLHYALTVDTGQAPPSAHIVQVRLRPKNGPPLRHYRQDLHCEAGRGEGFFPLALNEQAGAYLIEARDALTGTTGSAKVAIGP